MFCLEDWEELAWASWPPLGYATETVYNNFVSYINTAQIRHI